MKAFLMNWSLRPSCYACQAKSGSSHADLTIGDFWGIDRADIMPDDDKGISAIICRSEKGFDLLRQCTGLEFVECTYQDIFKSNSSIEKSVDFTDNARRFHRLLPKRGFTRTLRHIEHPSFLQRVKLSLRYRVSKLLGKKNQN